MGRGGRKVVRGLKVEKWKKVGRKEEGCWGGGGGEYEKNNEGEEGCLCRSKKG